MYQRNDLKRDERESQKVSDQCSIRYGVSFSGQGAYEEFPSVMKIIYLNIQSRSRYSQLKIKFGIHVDKR